MAALNSAFRAESSYENLYDHIELFNMRYLPRCLPSGAPPVNETYQEEAVYQNYEGNNRPVATNSAFRAEPNDEHLYSHIELSNRQPEPSGAPAANQIYQEEAANQTYEGNNRPQEPMKNIAIGYRMSFAMISVLVLSLLATVAVSISLAIKMSSDGSQCCCVSDGMSNSEIKQAINDLKVNQTGESEVFSKEKQQLDLIGQGKNATKVTDELRLTYEKVQQIHALIHELEQVKQDLKVNQTKERRMLDKVLQWMTAELKQEIKASKVNETREGRVFEEAIERMTAELKQEIRALKVNQTGERRVFDEAIQRMTAELKKEIRATKVNQTVEVPWIKMKTSPVCFGARDNTFGSFVVPSSGKLVSVKLVHVYGYVTSDKRNRAYWSFWGCGHYPEDVNVVITTSADNILFPSNEFFTGLVLKRSSIPGYNSHSRELVLSAVSNPPNVAGGQELRLWYGQDLANSLEGNNGGRSCCDVYVRLI